MPRYSLKDTFEKAEQDIGLFSLFFLDMRTYEMLHSILAQVEWDVENETEQDVYERISMELMDMATVQDLINSINTFKIDLLKALGNLQESESYVLANEDWIGTPNYPGTLAGATEVGVGEYPQAIFDNYANATGDQTDWEVWREYQCKAVVLIKRAALIMIEEILRLFDLPAITLVLFAAVLGTIVTLSGGLALPLIIVGAAGAAGLMSAVISVGQSGVEAAQTWLEDVPDVVWREITCIVMNSPHDVAAEDAIKEYIGAQAPEIALPFLLLMPWRSWVSQIYIGQNTDGNYLDVEGIQADCEDCNSPQTTFKGTSVLSCSEGFAYWTRINSNGHYYDNRASCYNGQLAPFPEFTDGVHGRLNSINPAIKSPNFTVATTGNYTLQMRAAGFNNENGNVRLRFYRVSDAVVVFDHNQPASNVNGDMMEVANIPLDASESYYLRADYGKFWFETYDNALYLQV